MFSAFGSMLNDDMENGLIENFENHNAATTAATTKTNCVVLDGDTYCKKNNNWNCQ